MKDKDIKYPCPTLCPNMCPDSLGFRKSRNKLPCPSLHTHTAPHESPIEKSCTVDCPSALRSEHLYLNLLRSRWGKKYSPQIFFRGSSIMRLAAWYFWRLWAVGVGKHCGESVSRIPPIDPRGGYTFEEHIAQENSFFQD